MRLLGAATLCVSLFYLADYVLKNFGKIDDLPMGGIVFPFLGLSAILYVGNHLTNQIAWLMLLRSMGSDLDARRAFGVGLSSQIGKYAPGNIAHQVSRAALAGRHGVPIGVVASASFVEAGAAAVACLMLGGLIAIASPDAFRTIPHFVAPAEHLRAAGVAAILGSLAATLALPCVIRRIVGPERSRYVPKAGRLIPVYLVGYLFAGGSFFLAALGFGADKLSLAAAVGVYALAWFAGFFTPGAPAGLGVREAVLVALLSASLGPAAAVAVAAAHRLITALVDGVAFLAGVRLLSRTASAAS